MTKPKITETDISKLTPDPNNARKRTPLSASVIRKSLEQFGAARSIVVDENDVIRAGNGTFEEAGQLGIEKVLTVEVDGNTIVAVKRKGLTEEQWKQYAIADNTASDFTTWDFDILSELTQEVDLSEFFPDDKLNELLEQLGKGESFGVTEQGEENEEEIAELLDKVDEIESRVKLGEIWALGDHSLLCGDCTVESNIKKLLGDQKVDIVFTSPPYASQRKYDEASQFKPISPDNYIQWYSPVISNIKSILKPTASYFLNIKEHAEEGERHLYVKRLTLHHCDQFNFKFIDEFCWQRNPYPGGYENRFKNGFEPVFHFALDTKIKFRKINVAEDRIPNTHNFENHNSLSGFKANIKDTGIGVLPSNVLKIETGEVNHGTQNHPATFPVKLPTFFILAFTDESDLVFDPFLGSGTTLIASEMTGRIAIGCELSPKYCEVILQRFEKLTGIDPKLIGRMPD